MGRGLVLQVLQLKAQPSSATQLTLTLQFKLQGLPHDLRGAAARQLPELAERLIHPGALDVDSYSTPTV